MWIEEPILTFCCFFICNKKLYNFTKLKKSFQKKCPDIFRKIFFEWTELSRTIFINWAQARNQSGQTKPYVSRLGSCQCCTLKLKCRIAMNLAFFGHLLDVYRKIFLTSLRTSQNKAIRFCFFPYPAATMLHLSK